MPKITIHHNINDCVTCPYFKWGRFKNGRVTIPHKCTRIGNNISSIDRPVPKWCPFLTWKDKIRRIFNSWF